MIRLWSLPVLAVVASPLSAQPKLIFSADFDGTVKPQVGRGDPILAGQAPEFEPHGNGQAYVADGSCVLAYPAEGNLSKTRGTVCLWVCPRWNGDDGQNHGFLADDIDFNDPPKNNLYLWKWVLGPSLRVDLRSKDLVDEEHTVSGWRAGEWHHIAAAWDCERGVWLFADGRLVAQRQYSWEAKAGTRFHVGADWQGQAPANALLDDLRIADAPLDAGQVRLIMRGRPIPVLTATGLTAPDAIAPGQPFRVTFSFDAAEAGPSVAVSLALDGVPLVSASPAAAKAVAQGANARRDCAFVLPSWYRSAPGPKTLSVNVLGAWVKDRKPWQKTVQLKEAPRVSRSPKWEVSKDGAVLLNGKPYLEARAGQAFWFDGAVRPYDEAGRKLCADLVKSGRIVDVIPCELIESVDCTKTDHDFREWGKSRLLTLADGRQYRLTGPPETVTETGDVYGSKQKVLPGFAYRLTTRPRQTAHLLVVESINDRERYLETAIDAVDGEPSPMLAESGVGGRDLTNLNVTYTGREYGSDHRPFQQVTLFFPKTAAVEVTITSSSREKTPGATSGAAVARMSVYEITRDLADLPVEPDLPEGKQRTVSLFYPWCSPLWEEYGSCAAGEATRYASVACLMDYLRFMGFNRLEFHPYDFGRTAQFDSKLFPQSGTADVFKEVLPVAQRYGIEVVPRIDSLCFYFSGKGAEQYEKTPDIYQLTRKGETMDFFGKVPDPLHPTVQQLMYDMLREMAERTKGLSCVPAIGFRANGKFGNLYCGTDRAHPPEESGYSEFDVTEFQKDTGLTVGGTPGNAESQYEWLTQNAWDQWIEWRCRRLHDHWVRCAQVIKEVDPQKDLIVFTKIPSNDPGEKRDWEKSPIDLLALHQYHGYDPALFTGDRGIILSRVMGIDADRYWPAPWNKLFFFRPELSRFFVSREPSGVELYYIYWELPDHPCGFRVGPASPLGRAYYEPMTHAIRTQNPGHFTFYNWFRATMGHEQDLREFCRAFRSLPMAEPAPFPGEVSVGATAEDNLDTLWVRQFGDRIALVNDSPFPCEVTLRLPKGYAPGGLRDVGLCEPCEITKAGTQREVSLRLRAWDLRVLRPG